MAEHPVQGEELQAFLDQQLDAARRAQVAGHLTECAECRTLVADLDQVSGKLRRWEIEPAPASLRPPMVLMGKLRLRASWGRLALGLSAATAVLIALVWIGRPNMLRSPIAANKASEIARQRQLMNLEASQPSDETSLKRIFPPTASPPDRLIAYQVALALEVQDFDAAKARAQRIAEAAGGYVAHAGLSETPRMPRRANLVLRVPAEGLMSILDQIRALGRVTQEQLSTEEVTEQVVDLEARLRNARATEERLIAVLRERTGKVKDILEVEREIARTREEIERMEAQRKNLMRRVEMATINVTLAEEFRAQLEPAPVGALNQLHNAAVGGYRNLVEMLFGAVLFIARYGLTLAFWLGISWVAWRRLGRKLVAAIQRD